jgi:Uma2 family endonuclease
MAVVESLSLMSVKDYLAAESVSQTKHEFVDGRVYRRPDERNTHHIIAGNIFASLHARLQRHSCRSFSSDMRIRLRMSTGLRFYYPDASVICRQNSQQESFQDTPAAIFEVLSKATRRTDGGEKKDAYLTMPSLGVYVLVEQESPAVVLFRRTSQGFVREVYEGLDAVLPLPEIDGELPLREVYDGVEFSPEPDPKN